jgi:hypothetical protein
VNSAERSASKSSILAKIWMSNIQLNALAAGFAYEWPPAMNSFFQYIAAGSNVTTFISVNPIPLRVDEITSNIRLSVLCTL